MKSNFYIIALASISTNTFEKFVLIKDEILVQPSIDGQAYGGLKRHTYLGMANCRDPEDLSIILNLLQSGASGLERLININDDKELPLFTFIVLTEKQMPVCLNARDQKLVLNSEEVFHVDIWEDLLLRISLGNQKSQVKNRCLISTWKTSTLIIHHINHRHIADIRRYCGYPIIALHRLFATIGHAGLILEKREFACMPQAIYNWITLDITGN